MSVQLITVLALIIAIKLGDIMVADGGGAEVQEDILRYKNTLRELIASNKVISEHDEGSRS
jgi:hypothetical protein